MRENVQAHIESGKAKFLQGLYGPAIESFSQALEIEPGNPFALVEIGKTFYVLQDYAQAIGYLKKSLEISRDDKKWVKEVNLLLAKAYKSIGEHTQAIDLLEQLIKAGTDRQGIDEELKKIYNDKYSSLLDVADFGHDYSLLAEEYKRRLELNRNDVKSIAHLAQIYNFQGLYHLTIPLIRKSLQLLPDNDIFFRNKLINELEIAIGKTDISSKVRRLTVTLSNRCNISCIMCLTSKHRWELPQKRIDEIIALFPYLEKVMWQGGEVFVLDYFRSLVGEAARYPNVRQSIVTNGQLITEEIAEELVKNNVELTFSVDGVSKDTYEYIRRGAQFEKLVRNIELINQLRKQHNSNIVMNMNVAVMAANYREIRGFIDFAARHQFGFVCLMPIHTHLKTSEDIFSNNDTEALAFLADEIENVKASARERCIRVESRLPLPVPNMPNRTVGQCHDSCRKEKGGRDRGEKKGYACHIPWYQLLLDYDGTVRPDCLCPPDRNAGHLADVSLEELWNGPVMREYRKRMAEGKCDGFCNTDCTTGKIAQEHLKLV